MEVRDSKLKKLNSTAKPKTKTKNIKEQMEMNAPIIGL